MLELITDHFPKFDSTQLERFTALDGLYREWNEKINVISRKDIEHLYLHHVLHSLALLKLISLRPGTRLLDLGCGGGFPGIPLAIALPHVDFMLIDSTGKKIKVVEEISAALGLSNVEAKHVRVEDFKEGRGQFDYVISRAVAALPQLWSWSRPMLSKVDKHSLPNGLIAYKGGSKPQLREELNSLHRSVYREQYPLREWYKDEFFWEKYLIYCN